MILVIAVALPPAANAGPPPPAGGGVPCNAWDENDADGAAWPPAKNPEWASQMPGCGENCMVPAYVAAYGPRGESVPCAGGAGVLPGRTPPDASILYGSTCPARDASGVVQMGDSSGAWYLRRNPACGPWKTTADVTKAFQGREGGPSTPPVCFPAEMPGGVISFYDPETKACAVGGYGGRDWRLLADDVVPGTEPR